MPDVTTTMPAEGQRARRGRDLPPADYLFTVVDAVAPVGSPARHRLEGLRIVQLGRGPERGATRHDATLALTFPDRWASSRHARLLREDDGWWIEDLGSKNGTFVAGLPMTRRKLFDGDFVEVGHTFLRLRTGLASSPGPDDLSFAQEPAVPGLATLLPDLEARFALMARAATTTAPLVILGETGTGKDVTARAYHVLTGRRGAFVPVNCGAIPASLVEATLFGHRKGAFSSATGDSLGLVRSAEGGTLFLDELGDLPLAAQAALLRLIEAREVLPVGAPQPLAVDVRIVAATHRDLPAMVREGSFRADLLARFSAHGVRLPPLRERKEDLGLLIAAGFQEHAPGRARRLGLDLDAARLLLARDYPLNTRELMNSLRRAIAHAPDDLLARDDLEADGLLAPPRPAAPIAPAAAQPEPEPEPEPEPAHPRALRRAQLEQLLARHQGNVSEVARAMGKPRSMVYRWLGRLGLDPASYRR